MNKSYRSIYNDALGVWIAASELGRSKGKRSRSGTVTAGVLVAGVLGVVNASAQFAADPCANTVIPTGGYAFGCRNTIPAGAFNTQILGTWATATQANSVLLGNRTTDRAATTEAGVTLNGVTYVYAGQGKADFGVLSIGTPGQERQIINVAAGNISENSTDAVNGSQLNATNKALIAGLPHFYSVNSTLTTAGNYDNKGATGQDALAAGVAASAGGNYAVAVGVAARAIGPSTVAIGDSSHATGIDDVNIGRGSGVGSLATNNANTHIGAFSGENVSGEANVGIGTVSGRRVTGNSNSAVGDGAGQGVAGDRNVAIGFTAGNSVTASNTISVGSASFASKDNAIAIGTGARATGVQSISIGTGNIVSGNNSGAIGDPNTISGSGSYATGNFNTIAANNAFVLGNNVTIASGLAGAVGLGNASTVSAATPAASATINGQTYTFAAAGATPAPGAVVSVGSATAPRQVQNVANGQVTATSLDAINGSQLYSVASALTVINSGGGIKYFHANSIAADSQAIGAQSVAIGPLSIATGANSLAAGNNSKATAEGATALGANTTADQWGVAIGRDASALTNTGGTGVASIAIGLRAFAKGDGSDAAGNNAAALAIGADANASADGAIALGEGSKAAGYYATTVGQYAGATAKNATALGGKAQATVEGAVALGAGSVASTGALVAGYVPAGASAAQESLIASTISKTLGAVSVGDVANGQYRQVNGVAAGTAATDAVNVAQLQAVSSQVALAGNKWIVGSQPDAAYVAPVATGTHSTAVGSGAAVHANSSVAVGTGATASTANSVALGNSSTTAAATPTAGTTIRGTNYSFAGANPTGVVSVGSAGAERQIQNVAAGQLSASSTDAVNGSQLHATHQALEAISAVASAGINMTTAATGTGIAIGTSVASVGAGGTATYTAGNNMVLTQSGANTTFAVSDNPNFGSVTVGSASITSNGINAGGHAITQVAPGVAGTDAVNVNQLNSASAANQAYTDGRVNALGNQMRGVAKNAYAGVAAAMAVQMPGSYVPGKTVMRIGSAVFKGESAVGVSFRRTADNNGWSVTGGVGLSRAGPAATVGVEWVFN